MSAPAAQNTTENVAPESPERVEEQKMPNSKATPAIVRARQQRREFIISSPSDSIMSPCTKKLVGRTSRTQLSHPINILRAKQQRGIPKMANLNGGDAQQDDSEQSQQQN
ncbi:hypothetical protein L596_004880 [Steinernema carpocapsae]|uniref:Uncharacterized protein n=1 Tax=Steinernema carpocapsae TaxID=34508 RepID=A0A4U8V0S2_STECR|nr:hypothetical protein L596_004880 [Steinernema carpocapsae]